MRNEEKVERLKCLLKELFQFENNDLDFGIYRIINLKKKEISEFIDKELFEFIKESVKTVKEYPENKDSLGLLRKEIERNFGCRISEAKKRYAETPKVRDYIERERESKKTDKEDRVEESIYDDIINFFSRYYDKGDFISKRRYSKSNKYAIPYNGEEVHLHWANYDQYYVKTGEHFKRYAFKAGGIKADFEIIPEEVEVEQGNIKDMDRKFFIFNRAEYDQQKRNLLVKFGYRGLTYEEEKKIESLNDKARIGKDEVNRYNLSRINKKIGIYGISELNKKHRNSDGKESDRSEIEWHLNKYTTKNTSDYFIHKDLKRFLIQELDFYIKNELLHIDDIDSKENLDVSLKRVRAFKQISKKIITFLAQIENFQRKLWEKKKFVISTDYCITLDYVDEMHYQNILENKRQLEEWKKLYSFDLDAELKKIKDKNQQKIQILKDNPTLAIDTKFYDSDFKYQILSEIDGLDEKTTGILINSDNFHALNLLQKKYEEKISFCYTDPMYNTGRDGFIYKDGFAHSSWLSLIQSRLYLLRNLLNNESAYFQSIDDNEQANLKILCDGIFGRENFVANFIWKSKSGGAGDSKFVAVDTEYILCFSKDMNHLKFNKSKYLMEGKYKDSKFEEYGKYNIRRLNETGIRYSKSLDFEVELPLEQKHYLKCEKPDKKTVIKPNKGNSKNFTWRWSEEKIKRGFEKGYLAITKNSEEYRLNQKSYEFFDTAKEIKLKEREKVFRNLITEFNTTRGTTEIKNLFSDKSVFSHPKPSELVQHLLKMGTSSDSEGIVLDFFAGTGTTAHAVLRQNAEMSEGGGGAVNPEDTIKIHSR